MKKQEYAELFAEWEAILENQGLGVISIGNISKKNSSEVDKILGIKNKEQWNQIVSECENLHKINIRIDGGTLFILNEDTGMEIGFIQKGHYSYHGLEKESHLESIIHDEYRGNGLGKILYALFISYGKIFKNPDFSLPKQEFSHKRSMIGLLTEYFQYEIIGKYIGGEFVSAQEIDEDEHGDDDELPFTYVLQKIK